MEVQITSTMHQFNVIASWSDSTWPMVVAHCCATVCNNFTVEASG